MPSNKLIGIAFLIVGLGVLVWAYNMSSSLGGQVEQMVSGSISMKALLAYGIGAVFIFVGVKRMR